MKNLLNTFSYIFVFIIFAGCDQNETNSEKDLIIEFGLECGWCAGQEYITITSSKVVYFRNITCGEEKGTTEIERTINSEEWEKITTSFDYTLFKTLNYNECNVCVDGCDEVIKITENNAANEIRYSAYDNIKGMQELRKILSDLLEEMRGAN